MLWNSVNNILIFSMSLQLNHILYTICSRYTMWLNIYGHLHITPICGPSLKCYHKVRSRQLYKFPVYVVAKSMKPSCAKNGVIYTEPWHQPHWKPWDWITGIGVPQSSSVMGYLKSTYCTGMIVRCPHTFGYEGWFKAKHSPVALKTCLESIIYLLC